MPRLLLRFRVSSTHSNFVLTRLQIRTPATLSFCHHKDQRNLNLDTLYDEAATFRRGNHAELCATVISTWLFFTGPAKGQSDAVGGVLDW